MSLYANINKGKKAGTSRPKSKSTITPEAYKNMQEGFPKKRKKRATGGEQKRAMYYSGGGVKKYKKDKKRKGMKVGGAMKKAKPC